MKTRMLLLTLLSSFILLPCSLVVSQAAVVLTTLHSFTGTNDGATPEAALVQASDGYFYGTTYNGGTNGEFGTVFKINSDGIQMALYSFGSITNADGLALDGANPEGALLQGNDGSFYGTTLLGGTNGGGGTVFRISTNGALTSLYSFTGGNGNAYPAAGLAQGNDGSFYGTTSGGGPYIYGDGTVFKMSTNRMLTTLYSFGTATNLYGTPLDGAMPQAGLVQGSDGNFYGTTAYAGGPGGGTVFRISTNGVVTNLHSFYGPDGAHPYAGLVQGRDGNFYGTTTYGGDFSFYNHGAGTVFQIGTNGALTTLYDFGTITNASGDALDGAHPFSALVQGTDGNYYGTTYDAGANGCGTVFKISTNGALTTLYALGSITNADGEPLDGAYPQAPLEQGTDGHFYGTTSEGGTYGNGTVFRLTIVPELQAVTLTEGTLNLTWSTEAGGTYQLQYNSDLSSSNWRNLSSPVTANGAMLNTSDSISNAPQRFYRLVRSP